MKKYILTSLLALVYACFSLESAVLIAPEINSNLFPACEIGISASSNGEALNLSNLNSDDFIITDNGTVCPVTAFTAPNFLTGSPLSATIVFDISSKDNATAQLVKSAVEIILESLRYRQSEAALLGFNHNNLAHWGFSADLDSMISIAQNVIFHEGIDFAHLFGKFTNSASELASKAKYKKIIIVITDNCPNGKINAENTIIDAVSNGLSYYFISLKSNTPAEFKTIADGSGGLYFENITDNEVCLASAFSIIQKASGEELFKLRWDAPRSCSQTHTLKIDIPKLSLSCQTNYTLTEQQMPHISYSPAYWLRFGRQTTGVATTRHLTISAAVADVTINNITSDNSDFSIVDYGGSQPPFTLSAGSSRTLSIQYIPKDSALSIAHFTISSDACSGNDFYTSGGIPFIPPSNPKLKLLFPNGGEQIVSGKDTSIRWEGSFPASAIFIEYSTNNGANWSQITSLAKDFSYLWKAPFNNSNSCLVRVRQMSSSDYADTSVFFRGHSSIVNSAVFSPNGLEIASASSDTTIKIWDLSDYSLSRTLSGYHSGAIFSIAYNPDGTQIASAGEDSSIVIRNAATGAHIHTLRGHGKKINSISWSSDGQYIASAGSDSLVILWKAATGERIKSYPMTAAVNAVAISPNCNLIAAGSVSKYLRVWNILSGAEQNAFQHTGRISSVSWNPGSDKVAASSSDNGIIIFDLATNTAERTLSALWVSSVSWSPDGRKLASSHSNDSIFVWDTSSWTIDEKLLGHTEAVNSIAWAPFGPYLASAAKDSTACFWIVNSIPFEVQSDISDNVFTIMRPTLVSNDVNMGDIAFTHSKIALIGAFLKNNSNYSVKISEISISGLNADEFSVTSECSGKILTAGESLDVSFCFNPKSKGAKTARIDVFVENDLLTPYLSQSITGNCTGFAPDVLIREVNFGKLYYPTMVDTSVILLKNNGTQNFTVDSIVLDMPNSSFFSILSGGGQDILLPGADKTILIRFQPTSTGNFSSIINIYGNGSTIPAIVVLHGECVQRDLGIVAMHVSNADESAGNVFGLPLYLDDKQKLTDNGIYKILTYLKVNANTLKPQYDTPKGKLFGDYRLIPVEISAQANAGLVLTYNFMAMLGNAEASPISLVNSSGLGGYASITGNGGTFTLNNVCKEGGVRLIGSTGTFSLEQNYPNPFSGQTNIVFTAIEEGKHVLEIHDLFGRIVAVVFDKFLTPGKYDTVFNAGEISPGVFFYCLKTPSGLITKRLEIVK